MSYKEDLKKRSDEIEEILADYAPKGDSPALLPKPCAIRSLPEASACAPYCSWRLCASLTAR